MKIRIPPPDVQMVDPATGRLTLDWYDILKRLETLGVLDLADVNAAPANTQTLRWDAASKKFIAGA